MAESKIVHIDLWASDTTSVKHKKVKKSSKFSKGERKKVSKKAAPPIKGKGGR